MNLFAHQFHQSNKQQWAEGALCVRPTFTLNSPDTPGPHSIMLFVSSYVPFTKLTSPSGTPIHLNVAIVISRGIASYESTNQSMNESMNLLAKLSDFCSRSLSPSHLSLPLSLFLSLSPPPPLPPLPGRHAGMQACRHAGRQADTHAGTQARRHAGRNAVKQERSQAGRQERSQAGTQSSRQARRNAVKQERSQAARQPGFFY